jgi:anthranilate phosphoribosyltransferase
VADTGLPYTPVEAVRGGDKEQNAATMRSLFQGEPGPVRDMVLLNSAGVLLVGDLVATIREGVQLAAEIIDSGAALDKLDRFVELTQRLGGDSA